MYSNDESLRNIQLAEFDMLLAVDKVFKELKLRYYLGAGTLLGAVRDGGFIPWDDDIDLDVPRPDLEEFIKLANDCLPDRYRLINYKTDLNYVRYVTRVIDTEIGRKHELPPLFFLIFLRQST